LKPIDKVFDLHLVGGNESFTVKTHSKHSFDFIHNSEAIQ